VGWQRDERDASTTVLPSARRTRLRTMTCTTRRPWQAWIDRTTRRSPTLPSSASSSTPVTVTDCIPTSLGGTWEEGRSVSPTSPTSRSSSDNSHVRPVHMYKFDGGAGKELTVPSVTVAWSRRPSSAPDRPPLERARIGGSPTTIVLSTILITSQRTGARFYPVLKRSCMAAACGSAGGQQQSTFEPAWHLRFYADRVQGMIP
jgi:hypothetical protein